MRKEVVMKNINKNALMILKSAIDKEVNADKQLSSKCISLFYQPKRVVAQENNIAKN